MITGLIIYCSGEIEPIEYDDKIFTIYNTEIKINNLSFNYCMHMDCYNFKLNDLDEFISFNNDEIKYIMNQFTGVL